MLLFQFSGVAERWLSADGWTGMREWSGHPDVDNVIADLERDGSLTTGLNWYRANIIPEAFVGPPIELPPVRASTMGVRSGGDFALTEDQMIGSARFCANGFRYERVDGAGHWMQIEAPTKSTRCPRISFPPESFPPGRTHTPGVGIAPGSPQSPFEYQ
jgi:pimeloyl-ACP methyl ester carboxylesterase